MTLLPIVERELRVRARRSAGHWMRFGIALVGLLVCLPQLIMPAMRSGPGGPGQGIFGGLVDAAFLLSCSASLLTAEALVAERKEGTLGLLFLTRVRALDVLLGKFGSIGLTCLCGLLSFMPIMVVPLLAGGVTGGEAVRKGLALLATLCFALTIGLWAATSSKPSGTRRRTVWGLLLVLLLPFCLSRVPEFKAVGVLSPLMAVIAAGDSAYRSAPGWYWASLLSAGLLAVALLLVATLRLRRVKEETEAEAPAPAPVPFTLFNQPITTSGRWLLGQAEKSPVAWLVRRQPGLRTRLWTAAVLAFLFRLAAMGLTRSPGLLGLGSLLGFWGIFWFALSAIEGALIAWAASQFFIQGRRNAEFEVLATTPLGGRELISEQWKALRRLLIGPLVVMLIPALLRLLMLYATPGGLTSGIWIPAEYRLQVCISVVFSAAEKVLQVFALCWLGLWFGYKARTQANAILWPVGLAVGGPYLLSMLVSTLFYGFFLAPRLRTLGTAPWSSLLVSWGVPLLILLLECGLIRWARDRLLSELAGAAPGCLDFNSLASVLRRARHWTPS